MKKNIYTHNTQTTDADLCSFLLRWKCCEEISNSSTNKKLHTKYERISRSSSKSIAFMHFKFIILKYHPKQQTAKCTEYTEKIHANKLTTHLQGHCNWENWFVIVLFWWFCYVWFMLAFTFFKIVEYGLI